MEGIWKETFVVEVLCRHFPVGAEEIFENPQPEYPVSVLRLQLSCPFSLFYESGGPVTSIRACTAIQMRSL